MATKKTVKLKRKTKPKIEIDLDKVEVLASRGLSNEQIAYALGICERTLYNNKKESAEFADAIKRGKASGITKVANALMKKAIGGDTTAMIFFLKSQAQWRETNRTELTGADGNAIQAVVKNEGVDGWEQMFQKLKAPKKS